jgi:hypothetical protein
VSPFAVNSTPDTDCTRYIIPNRIAQAQGLVLEKDDTIIVAANGEKMNVLGSANLTAKKDSAVAEISALMSNVVAEDMLISWQDLIRLRVISPNFPQAPPKAKARNVSCDDLVKQLTEEFPDVISDTLPSIPSKTGDPMKIHLLQQTIPKKSRQLDKFPITTRKRQMMRSRNL